MTYRQFMLTLSDDVTPTESMRLYEGFRLQHARRAREEYFQAHKGEQWLKSKFHPSSFEACLESRNRLALDLAAAFALEIKNKTLDPLRHCSETYKAEDPSSSAPRFSTCALRIDHDVTLSRTLLLHLDKDKGIESLPLFQDDDNDGKNDDEKSGSEESNWEKLSLKELGQEADKEKLHKLDVQLEYLWRVHRVDYYGGKESAGYQDMQRAPAAWGARTPRPPHLFPSDDITDLRAHPTVQAFAKWCEEMESTWRGRVRGGEGELERRAGRRETAVAEEAWLDANVRKIEEGKFGCMQPGCPKRFWGPDFVKKHLRTKHVAALEPVLLEHAAKLYKRNFMDDPADLALPDGGTLPHAGAAPPPPLVPPPSASASIPTVPTSAALGPASSSPPTSQLRAPTLHYQVPPHGSPPPPPRNQRGRRPDYSPPPARDAYRRDYRDRDRERDMDRDRDPPHMRGRGRGGGSPMGGRDFSLSPPRRGFAGGRGNRNGSPYGRDAPYGRGGRDESPPYGREDGYSRGGYRGRDGYGGWPGEDRNGYDEEDRDGFRRRMPPGRGGGRPESPYQDNGRMIPETERFEPVPGPAPPPMPHAPPETRMIPIGPPGPLPPGAVFVPLPGAGPMGPFIPMMPGPSGPVPIMGARPMAPMAPPLPGGGMVVIPRDEGRGPTSGPNAPNGPRPPPVDGPQPPPVHMMPSIQSMGGRDPRSIRQYVDLDAPGNASMMLDYRDL